MLTEEEGIEETMAGKIVLGVGHYPHVKDGEVVEHGQDYGCTPEQKKALDELHLRKIDLADEVLVLNCLRAWCLNHQRWTDRSAPDMDYCCANIEMRGYIGNSTRREIEYAMSRGKLVRFLEAVP